MRIWYNKLIILNTLIPFFVFNINLITCILLTTAGLFSSPELRTHYTFHTPASDKSINSQVTREKKSGITTIRASVFRLQNFCRKVSAMVPASFNFHSIPIDCAVPVLRINFDRNLSLEPSIGSPRAQLVKFSTVSELKGNKAP